MTCPRCDGLGYVSMAPGGNPDRVIDVPCECSGIESCERDRDDDDGIAYADPRDGQDRREMEG